MQVHPRRCSFNSRIHSAHSFPLPAPSGERARERGTATQKSPRPIRWGQGLFRPAFRLRQELAAWDAEGAADAGDGVNGRDAGAGLDVADHLAREAGQFREPVEREAAGRAPLPDDRRQRPAHRFQRGSRQRFVGSGQGHRISRLMRL